MRVARPSTFVTAPPGRWRHAGAVVGLVVLSWWSSSCSPVGFASDAVVASVRVFASSADKPYANPGDTVTMQVLAFDGRPAEERGTDAMNVVWLPFACKNPAGDAYYNCFSQANLGAIPSGGVPVPTGGNDAGAADGAVVDDGGDAAAGADAGAFADGGTPAACTGLAPDAGIPSPVVSGFQFTVPEDAVSSHPVVAGAGAPYGLEILFNVACAGQAKIIPLNANNGNPQQIPIACVSGSGQTQGPDDYVFGFTRVYAHEADSGVTNANPVISSVDFQDFPVDAGPPPTCFQGVTPTFFTGVLDAPLCLAGTKSCPHLKLGPVVPPSSQETDLDSMQKELLWVDYYSTFGGFNGSSKILYDPSGADVGGLAKTDTEFEPPIVGEDDPRDGYIFMVVHDNRGGAAWVTVPVHLQ